MVQDAPAPHPEEPERREGVSKEEVQGLLTMRLTDIRNDGLVIASGARGD
jgi:hypothetical protein